MSKHTPGPWHYAAGYLSTYVNGDYIMLAELHSKLGSDNFGDEPLMLGPQERSANGHLMAAAPEMYELMKTGVRFLQNVRQYHPLSAAEEKWEQNARELMVKIEGGRE